MPPTKSVESNIPYINSELNDSDWEPACFVLNLSYLFLILFVVFRLLFGICFFIDYGFLGWEKWDENYVMGEIPLWYNFVSSLSVKWEICLFNVYRDMFIQRPTGYTIRPHNFALQLASRWVAADQLIKRKLSAVSDRWVVGGPGGVSNADVNQLISSSADWMKTFLF